MTFRFLITFTWWLGHLICLYVDKIHVCSKSQTLRMRYPFQSTNRPISHRSKCSFRVYMIPLRDFVPEWNSRPGTTTGVNSRRDGWLAPTWHFVVVSCKQYRAVRGNRSELAPARRSPRCHVNTPQETLPKSFWSDARQLEESLFSLSIFLEATVKPLQTGTKGTAPSVRFTEGSVL